MQTPGSKKCFIIKVEGQQKFECGMIIKGGKITYDLNGIANIIYVKNKK